MLGATGDVVAILGTMKSLVAAADLQWVVQQKLERDTDIGGNEEAALLAGAPYSGGSGAGAVSVPPRVIGRPRLKRWESAPGLPPHVHSSRVLGGDQELLRPQAALRDGGGAGGAGSRCPCIRSGCSSLTAGSGCSRFSCGNDPWSRAFFGSGWEHAGAGSFAFLGSHTRGNRRRGRSKRGPWEQESHSPLGAAGGCRSLLRFLSDTTGVSAAAVPASDGKDSGRGSGGGGLTSGGDGRAALRADGDRDEEARLSCGLPGKSALSYGVPGAAGDIGGVGCGEPAVVDTCPSVFPSGGGCRQCRCPTCVAEAGSGGGIQ